MPAFHWFTQTTMLGLGVAFSPINIALVALLLLGQKPLLRCGSYLTGWALANGGALWACVLFGQRFSHTLQVGGRGQVLVDLLGAGALLGLGLFQLTPAVTIGEEGWAMQLMQRLPEMDMGPLLGLGMGCALISPENLVFYVKEAGLVITNRPGMRTDLEIGSVFVLMATSLLLVPPLLWILSGGRLEAPLTRAKDWLVHRAEPMVGLLALLLAAYLGWQGFEGLLSMGSSSLV